MKIESINAQDSELRIKFNSNEESILMLLKSYLEDTSGVDIVGVNRDHHLLDETEFFLRVDSGSAKDTFSKALKAVKKELEGMRV
ncbi:MAG: RpoL/Rpb11 RNA polymerase subunit family protein [Candidatus Nanoarchaeia archaeon]